MKRAQSCIWTLLPAILFLFLTFGHVQAIGVQPLVFELDLKPGDIAPFEIIAGADDTRNRGRYLIQHRAGTGWQQSFRKKAITQPWAGYADSTQVLIPPGNRAHQGEVHVPLMPRGRML